MIPNESEKVFRDCFIELDGSKNNKEFDTKLPGYLDLFVEYPVFAEALELFKAGEDELAELNQHALQQIRAKNSKAEEVCRENGIALPAYRADVPLDDDVPLVMCLHFALFKTLLIMEENGLSLEEEETDNNTVEPDYYEQWLEKWHALNGFVVYNLLLLHRDNRYKSLLKRYMLPSTNILEEPCGLKALMRCSLPAHSEQDRLSGRKLTAYRLYFYALKLHDQSRDNGHKELAAENVISPATPIATTVASKPLIIAKPDPDNKRKILLSTEGKEDRDFKRYELKKGEERETLHIRLLLLVRNNPDGISMEDLIRELQINDKQIYRARRSINEPLAVEWKFYNYIDRTKSGKLKINKKYPTEFHF